MTTSEITWRIRRSISAKNGSSEKSIERERERERQKYKPTRGRKEDGGERERVFTIYRSREKH